MKQPEERESSKDGGGGFVHTEPATSAPVCSTHHAILKTVMLPFARNGASWGIASTAQLLSRSTNARQDSEPWAIRRLEQRARDEQPSVSLRGRSRQASPGCQSGSSVRQQQPLSTSAHAAAGGALPQHLQEFIGGLQRDDLASPLRYSLLTDRAEPVAAGAMRHNAAGVRCEGLKASALAARRPGQRPTFQAAELRAPGRRCDGSLR